MNKITRLLVLLSLLFHLAPAPARAEAGPSLPYRTYLPVTSRAVMFDFTRMGPSYGRVLGVEHDPFNPAVVYAMTYGSGMYKSLDAGASWFPISAGINYLTLQSMAVDPANPNTIYAGTYGDAPPAYTGIYKSVDGGASWFRTGELGSVWYGAYYNRPVVYALVVDPNNSQRIFAGTRMKGLPGDSLGGGGVFRSENGGGTWEPVNRGLPYEDLYVYDLALDPNNPGRVYAALHEHGLYRSDDYGSSWVAVSGTPYAGRAIAIDPFDSRTLYFGAMKKLGAYRSTDSGASWSRIGAGWDVAVGALSPDPYHERRVYAGVMVDNAANYLMRSTSSGGSWSVAAGLPTWGPVSFAPDGSTALVGVDGDGPYKTADGGQTWFRSAQGLTGYSITGLAISPSDRRQMFTALYGLGVFRSNDGGQSWSPVNTGLGSLNLLSLSMDPNNPAVLFATTSDASVYTTTNGGAYWSALSAGFPTMAAAVDVAAVEEPGSDAKPYDPFENRPLPERDDLLENPDQPAPRVESALAGFAAGNAVAVSPQSSNVVLLASSGRGILRLSGGNWTPTSITTGSAYGFAFDSAALGRVLAATDAASGSVLASADNGRTWAASNRGIAGRTVYSLAQDPANPLLLSAGTDSGVYFSTDGGANWAAAGLQGQAVKAVGISSSGGGPLFFAGTDAGVYYSERLSAEWQMLSPSLSSAGVQGIVRDPGSRTVYILTRLGGITVAMQK